MIFMQIQSGKLTFGGFIDEDSVHWVYAPADLKTNVHTLNYDNRKLLLEELKFPNDVLTGEKFIKISKNLQKN